MPTHSVFRLSTYLTLALACACLGYAERTILPEIPFLAGAVIVSLVVLFRLETRIRLLSIPDANRVGLVLGLVYLGWAAIRIARVFREPGRPDLEWQLLLVALVGPLLLVTIPAKLARREKHVGDYWWFQGVALAAVALSAAIAEDSAAFVLIGLYALCAVWSLRILHLLHAAGQVPEIPNRPTGARVAGVVARLGPRVGFWGGVVLTAVGVAVAIPLYLLTPRSPFAKLEFGQTRVQTGYSTDQLVDLRQTGELIADDRVAFHVRAEKDGVPDTTLSQDQRWRGRVMRRYFDGGWHEHGGPTLPTVETALPLCAAWSGQVTDLIHPLQTFLATGTAEAVPRRPLLWTRPDLWPGQITLTFTVSSDVAGGFLAEPVVWVPGEPIPAGTLRNSGADGWHWMGDGSLFWDFSSTPPSSQARYVQIWNPAAPPDRSPPLRLIDRNSGNFITPLLYNPVQRLKDYADSIVKAMVANGQLPADYRDRITLLPRQEFHARIAQALTRHLATTPELSYTTNLRRERKDIDPIEDFLFYTKSGHCQRFASALVLMLRSQGIPAVYVLGFKGCEATEEPGEYVVRQEHAHAWACALMPAEGQSPDTDPRGWVYHWVSLDPTPAGTGPEQSADSGRIGAARSWLRNLYNEYVVNYSAASRRKALAAIGNWLISPEVLAVLAAVVAAVVWGRFARRATRYEAPAPDYPPQARWFADLMKVLVAHGFAPEPGQTAREFALAVAESLRERSETAGVARVPLDWSDAYYEARFGEHPVPPDRLAELERGLRELERALTRTPNK
jgi:protein-glutamine gamma-glutamyltransferase